MRATEKDRQRMKIYYLKVTRKKRGYKKYCPRWSKSDINYLSENYGKIKVIKISKILNRSERSVLSQAYLLKLHSSNKNELNGNWYGKKVGYAGVHSWVKRRKIKPEVCENCKINIPIDLANISGIYKRNVNDFKWLCRSCHMNIDGRINNLLRGRKNGQIQTM